MNGMKDGFGEKENKEEGMSWNCYHREREKEKWEKSDKWIVCFYYLDKYKGEKTKLPLSS